MWPKYLHLYALFGAPGLLFSSLLKYTFILELDASKGCFIATDILDILS